VSLPEYSSLCYEDNVTPRCHESLDLFAEVIESPWFQDSHIILVLNKVDALEEALKRVPLKSIFPDYTGDPHDVRAATMFLKNKYLSLIQKSSKKVYPIMTSMMGKPKTNILTNMEFR
jgi:50S ribosomal subunit-associated GTPase HflX